MDPIPSITENQADGEIAQLYRDIKHTLAVPTTNLIWRHLATIDGALPAVWRVLKPWYLSSELNAVAADIRRNADVTPMLRLSEARLLSLGVDGGERARVISVLRNYDKTNPANLVALGALLARLEGRALRGELPRRATSSNAVDDIQLPRLIAESEMTVATQTAVHRLNALGLDPPPSELIAAVPRHLAHWPQLLNVLVEQLAQNETQIAQAINDVQHRAGYFSRIIAARLDEPTPDIDWKFVVLALRRFTAADLIANYIVKVSLLLEIIGNE